jgi:phage minor structural protein
VKLYLLDANENIIAMPPTKDLLSLIQDLKLKDTDTIEGALVVSKRYTSIMDNVRYIAVSDRDNDHAFYLYRKTMAEVQDRELIFDGKESFWDDLAGSYIKDKRPDAMLAPDLVKLILDGTRWNVDFVDSGFTETLDTNFYYQSRSDALSSVMSAMTIDIVPMINIEGNTITRRYVNLYLQAGGDNGRRFVYGKNALSVVKKTDDSQVFTALVGRGKSIEQTSTDTETGETTTYNTPKINFADVEWSKAAGDPVDKPKGQEYVEWPEATKLYGYSNGYPRIGIIEFADDDDPEQLLKDTWDQLQTVGVPSVQFSATVGDVGYLAKGETVTIVNYVKGIAYKTRVTELKWNRLAEAKSQLTIGDKLVKNANERMTAIAATQSSALQDVSERMNKQVANLVTLVNESGQNVSYSKDGTMPTDPKENDIAFVRNDDGSVSLKQFVDGKWIILVDDTTGTQIANKVDAKMDQLNADLTASDANLKAAKQDVADLQDKIKANDDAQAQLKIDLSDNTELINQVKTDTANSLEKVNKTLTQAKSDSEKAVKNADLAVTNAQSAADASGLATQTANAASDAALAAKNLATQVSSDFDGVRSQAATAASDSADAISAANKAQGDATSALGNSNTAISNAKDALNKYNNLVIGARNYLADTGTPWQTQGSGGTNLTSGNNWLFTFGKINQAPFKDGEYVTLSFDYTSVGTGAYGTINPQFNQTPWGGFNSSESMNDTGHVVRTVQWKQSWTTSGMANGIQIRMDNVANTRTVTVYNMQFERGNKDTDYKAAPEDAQIQISNINGELSQKVNQTSFDTLNGTVTSQGTLIDQNSKAIELKANQSTVDTLSGEVSDNTSQLKLTATAASLEVTSKKVDTLSQTVTDQGAKLDLTATSAQLKVTEKKVDALNKTVSDNSAQLKLTATSAALETQSNRVDTISGKVDTNAAAITAANGAIELKANSSTVDALAGTVKQQGIDLKAAQGQLALKLTQSDLTKGLDGYATQTWAQNQLDITAQGIQAQLTSVQTNVDSIQVGGRNLWQQLDSVNGYFGTSTTDSEATIHTAASIHRAMKTLVEVTAGEKLIASIYNPNKVVNTGNSNRWGFYDASGNLLLPLIQMDFLTGEPIQRFTVTVPENAVSVRLAFIQGPSNGEIDESIKIKVERGTIATDWSPAPEDSATYTDAKIADFKVTVDGLSATFAKQTDLEKATSDFKVTADGLNLLTTATGTKGEKVTQVIADVKNIKTTMTGPNGYTTRLQTLEGFQTSAQNDISGLQSWRTQTADTLQSVVAQQATEGTNLVSNGSFKDSSNWRFDDGVATGFYNAMTNVPISAGTYVRVSAVSDDYGVVQQPSDNVLNALKGKTVNLSVYGRASGATSDTFRIYLRVTDSAGTNTYFFGKDSTIGNPWQRYSVVATLPIDIAAMNITIEIRGLSGANVYLTGAQITIGETLMPYVDSTLDFGTQTQITQLQNQIDLRTTVAGKVTAALNLSNDGGGTVTIRGASLYVTADSHFDNASIKSAYIASLDATKITSGSISSDRLATTKLNADNITSGKIAAARIATTALSATNITSGTLDVGKLTVKNLSADLIASGTIDASKITVKNLSASNIIGGELDAGLVNVKNLDASNIITGTLNAGLVNVIGLNAASITTGTITGANLAINLNSGQVIFQSGRIHSTTDNIDINVDKGYMSVADSSNRVILKGGKLQFIQPQLFDLQTTPYLSISNDGVGSNWAGATIVGRDSVIVSNAGNTGDSILTWELGQNNFSGLMTGKNSDGSWMPTLVGGANRGVVILGGTATDAGSKTDYTPRIIVGATGSKKPGGRRILLEAEQIQMPVVYNTTVGGSANVSIGSTGLLYRTTSASKYKTNITRSRSTAMGETLLQLPTARWYDKGEMARYANGDQPTPPKLNFGMIAEDLAAAGLEDLVQRGDDGELEGINYDRIAPALLPLLAKMKQEIEELKGEKSA